MAQVTSHVRPDHAAVRLDRPLRRTRYGNHLKPFLILKLSVQGAV